MTNNNDINKMSSGWNCGFSSSDNNIGGFTTSSDRFTCEYSTSSGNTFGGYVSSDSSYGGTSHPGSGYGAGISFGFRF